MKQKTTPKFSEIPARNEQLDSLAASFCNDCLKYNVPVNVMLAYIFILFDYRLVSSTISKSVQPTNSERVIYEVFRKKANGEDEQFFFINEKKRDEAYDALSALNLEFYKSAETIKHHVGKFFWDNNIDNLVDHFAKFQATYQTSAIAG